ncbi:hypothetical protein O3P69_011360 [Scylla paramamosain]|uniref:Uncharacterized protein n=1 Tax=Scylla paramamosain TaxID=85552 RepID=A0AAW0T688_SCYPA
MQIVPSLHGFSRSEINIWRFLETKYEITSCVCSRARVCTIHTYIFNIAAESCPPLLQLPPLLPLLLL